MGSAISKAANAIGALLGNAFIAPFKTIFGGSCEGICSGTWDITCFIEHLCISNLIKLLMVSGLCYITLMFMYLLFKVGIFQCIGRSLCKMGWAACETYWYALEDISCFLWHKLKNTKRVNHRKRFQDVEVGYSSSEESDSSLDNYRKRKSYGERRYDKGYSHRHRHVRLKTREVSVHVKGGSRRGRKSRRVQRRKGSNCRRDTSLFKRQRLQ